MNPATPFLLSNGGTLCLSKYTQNPPVSIEQACEWKKAFPKHTSMICSTGRNDTKCQSELCNSLKLVNIKCPTSCIDCIFNTPSNLTITPTSNHHETRFVFCFVLAIISCYKWQRRLPSSIIRSYRVCLNVSARNGNPRIMLPMATQMSISTLPFQLLKVLMIKPKVKNSRLTFGLISAWPSLCSCGDRQRLKIVFFRPITNPIDQESRSHSRLLAIRSRHRSPRPQTVLVLFRVRVLLFSRRFHPVRPKLLANLKLRVKRSKSSPHKNFLRLVH
ncbi:hypothetical protein F4604DRAFT_1275889 [Suillus subluteus]|nr:hypothetical protein F4604DRAFT_1275889 [Suillus subluteus]